MFSFLRLTPAPAPTPRCPSTPSPSSQADASTSSTCPKAVRQESWELLSAPGTPLPSPPRCRPSTQRQLSPISDFDIEALPPLPPSRPATPKELSPIGDFDTEAFPPHSHLFPSSPNGTWRDEAVHSLKHPSTIDAAELRLKLRALAEAASDELSARVNKACEGKDVPAMHDKVVRMCPSVSLPSMRQVDKMVDNVCDKVETLVGWIRG
jgi:hypothetical protein